MEEATARPDDYDHPEPNVMYVMSNIPGPGSNPDDFDMPFSVGCSCDKRDCQNAKCTCTRGNVHYRSDHGTLVLTSPSTSQTMIIECNANCKCDTNCDNRLVQNGPLDCLVVKKSPKHDIGHGLFTKKFIKSGSFICEYAGEVIGIKEARRRFEENRATNRMNYVLVVTEHLADGANDDKIITTCLDPSLFGNIGRYANHSCEPNARLVPVRVDIAVPRLCLFALIDIQPENEITFNYADDDQDDCLKSVHDRRDLMSDKPCLCGTASCVGYLPHSRV